MSFKTLVPIARTFIKNLANSGYFIAAFGAICFSMKAIFIKLAYGPTGQENLEVDAITLLALRMVFALPIYIAIGIWAWRERIQETQPLPTEVGRLD